MLKAFRTLKFWITDTWASRKESVDMPERREFYRNSGGVFGRGLGGATGSTIESHTKGDLKPPVD